MACRGPHTRKWSLCGQQNSFLWGSPRFVRKRLCLCVTLYCHQLKVCCEIRYSLCFKWRNILCPRIAREGRGLTEISLVSGWEGRCLWDGGDIEVSGRLSGGCVAPPAASMHLDRHLLLACLHVAPSASGGGFSHREGKICVFLERNKFTSRKPADCRVICVDTIMVMGEQTCIIHRSRKGSGVMTDFPGSILGRDSTASGQDFGPPSLLSSWCQMLFYFA